MQLVRHSLFRIVFRSVVALVESCVAAQVAFTLYWYLILVWFCSTQKRNKTENQDEGRDEDDNRKLKIRVCLHGGYFMKEKKNLNWRKKTRACVHINLFTHLQILALYLSLPLPSFSPLVVRPHGAYPSLINSPSPAELVKALTAFIPLPVLLNTPFNFSRIAPPYLTSISISLSNIILLALIKP